MDGASLLGTRKGFGSRAKKMVSLGVHKVSCSRNLSTKPRKIGPGTSGNNILHTTQASTHKIPLHQSFYYVGQIYLVVSVSASAATRCASVYICLDVYSTALKVAARGTMVLV